jgi:hypothetical protein
MTYALREHLHLNKKINVSHAVLNAKYAQVLIMPLSVQYATLTTLNLMMDAGKNVQMAIGAIDKITSANVSKINCLS